MTDTDRIVDRSAPQWAWDLIDETLHYDSVSKAFDKELRQKIAEAFRAMVYASENPHLDSLRTSDIPEEF